MISLRGHTKEDFLAPPLSLGQPIQSLNLSNFEIEGAVGGHWGHSQRNHVTTGPFMPANVFAREGALSLTIKGRSAISGAGGVFRHAGMKCEE